MQYNRREVLGAVASGIGVIGFSELTEAAPDSREIKKVDNIGKIISKANRDKNAKILIKYLKKEGWVPQYKKGNYFRVITEGQKDFTVAAIPFRNTGTSVQEDTQTVLKWSSKPDSLTAAYQLYDSGKEKKYHVTDGNVVINESDSIEVMNDEPLEDGGDAGGGIECSVWKDKYCVEWDLACIITIIGALGLACNPYTGALACFLGADLEVFAFITGNGCNPCETYSSQYVTVCDPNR